MPTLKQQQEALDTQIESGELSEKEEAQAEEHLKTLNDQVAAIDKKLAKNKEDIDAGDAIPIELL